MKTPAERYEFSPVPHGFAAANGGDGFLSYYDRIFPAGKFDRFIVIKGGPGTGKSRLLSDAAETAEADGHICEYLHCSSDPASLDGIIIYKKDGGVLGMVDGTAPHAREALLPGACDELFDLGAFWDSDALRESRAEIEALCERKSERYRRAYLLLRGAAELSREAEERARGCLLHGKLEKAAERLLAGLSGVGYREEIRIQNAISMQGKIGFRCFPEIADRFFLVKDEAGLAGAVLSAVRREAERRGLSVIISYSPLDKKRIDGLYIEESGISFMPYDGDAEEDDKIIRCARFINRDALAAERDYIRFLTKKSSALEKRALECLSDAKNHHFALEKIYSSAVDFDKKETACNELIKELLR